MSTFANELWTSCAWRIGEILSDLAILFLTQEFMLYIENPVSESVLPEVLPVDTMELAKLYM